MTEKPIPSKSKKAGNPAWVKGMKSPNPEGRRLEKSRKEQIEKVLTNTPAQIVKLLGGRNELTIAFKKMPPDIPLVELLTLRIAAATMFEPQPGLVNFLFDGVYGKVQNTFDVTSAGEKLGPSVVIFQDADENSDAAAPAPSATEGAGGDKAL